MTPHGAIVDATGESCVLALSGRDWPGRKRGPAGAEWREMMKVQALYDAAGIAARTYGTGVPYIAGRHASPTRYAIRHDDGHLMTYAELGIDPGTYTADSWWATYDRREADRVLANRR